jgi:two-component system response regulator SaeR
MRTNKILIIEDDKALSKILKKYLEEHYFSVDLAENGKNGLEKIRKKKYKVALLDLIMPEKTGFEVLEELDEKEKEETTIIVFSNLSRKEDKDEAMGLGAKGYYIKNKTSLKELIRIVKRYMDK